MLDSPIYEIQKIIIIIIIIIIMTVFHAWFQASTAK